MNYKSSKILCIIILTILGITYFIIKPSVTKIAFLGDSITEYGWKNKFGYVQTVVELLKASGLKIKPIPAWICGNTTKDMLKRLDKDILSQNPDVIFFMGGINDIDLNAVPFDEFKQNIKTIIKKINTNNIKLYIISITLISEDINSPKNIEVDRYNEFLKEITTEQNVYYIDVNTKFKEELEKHKNRTSVLTTDGIHLNHLGNKILAETIVNEYLKNN